MFPTILDMKLKKNANKVHTKTEWPIFGISVTVNRHKDNNLEKQDEIKAKI